MQCSVLHYCSVPCLIDKDIVKESISKMKNGKAAAQSGLVSEMVKVKHDLK